MFEQFMRVKAVSVRGVAVVALCAIAAATWLAVQQHSQTEAKAATSDPDPYAVPVGTVIRDIHVHEMPGAIRSATSRDGDDQPYESDIRTLGTPMIDGNYRPSDDFVFWGEEVDLGAIYNASPDRATIAFDSGLIVDLQPDEVIFTSSTKTYLELLDALFAADFECKCKCNCPCLGVGESAYVPCDQAPEPGDCESLDGETCECDDHDSSTFDSCERVYRKVDSVILP